MVVQMLMKKMCLCENGGANANEENVCENGGANANEENVFVWKWWCKC